MNKTKKGFLIAGSIIAILLAGFMMLVSLGLAMVNMMINEEFIIEDYRNDPYYEIVENADGSYVVYDELGNIEITSEDVGLVVNLTKTIINGINFFNVAIFVPMLIFAIRILVKVSKSKDCKGSIITLLVLSLFYCNLITAAFMIVALCLKDNHEENKNNDIQISLDSTAAV